ncbi:hypothetical protein ACX93W_05280 [Paenibacillus sp. CAU 1782]
MVNETEKHRTEDKSEKWTLKRLLWIVGIIWLLLGVIMYFISPNWDDRGTLGDMFGSINALFAGLAFAGIIYTIAIQRKELELQRKAIELQTEEMKGQKEETARSADQLEQQRKLMNFQICLATLNGMLAVKKDGIDNITINQSTKGFATFNHIINLKKRSMEVEIEKCRLQFNYYLSVYFDILQYIFNAELDKSQKDELVNLVFTHTSSEEVAVLMFFSEDNQHRSSLLSAAKLGEKLNVREYSKNGVYA